MRKETNREETHNRLEVKWLIEDYRNSFAKLRQNKIIGRILFASIIFLQVILENSLIPFIAVIVSINLATFLAIEDRKLFALVQQIDEIFVEIQDETLQDELIKLDYYRNRSIKALSKIGLFELVSWVVISTITFSLLTYV